MLSQYYLTDITPYPAPWYVPNGSVLAMFVFACVVQHGLELAGLLKGRNDPLAGRAIALIRVLGMFILSATLVLTLCAAYQLRIQQREIEDGQRKQIGLWLRQNADAKSDTVFLEPLGYIGFFSQLKMLDWPGFLRARGGGGRERAAYQSLGRTHPGVAARLAGAETAAGGPDTADTPAIAHATLFSGQSVRCL